MGVVAERLAAEGRTLPPAPSAIGGYVPARRAAGLVFTAGQLPMRDGALMRSGAVGAGVTPEDAAECAAQAALNALAAASTVCDLDEVTGVVKMVGYVASDAGFTGQPAVMDGASAVLAAAFGQRGVHAREAVGVVALPLGAPVEVSLVLDLSPPG